MEGVSNHIDYQLHNGQTKVQYLLDDVDDCQNNKVCAAFLDIYDIGHGMSTKFEKAAALLIPNNPAANKSNKRKSVLLSLRLQGPRVALAPVG